MGEFFEIFEEQLQTAASKWINYFLFILDFEEIFAMSDGNTSWALPDKFVNRTFQINQVLYICMIYSYSLYIIHSLNTPLVSIINLWQWGCVGKNNLVKGAFTGKELNGFRWIALY